MADTNPDFPKQHDLLRSRLAQKHGARNPYYARLAPGSAAYVDLVAITKSAP